MDKMMASHRVIRFRRVQVWVYWTWLQVISSKKETGLLLWFPIGQLGFDCIWWITSRTSQSDTTKNNSSGFAVFSARCSARESTIALVLSCAYLRFVWVVRGGHLLFAAARKTSYYVHSTNKISEWVMMKKIRYQRWWNANCLLDLAPRWKLLLNN